MMKWIVRMLSHAIDGLLNGEIFPSQPMMQGIQLSPMVHNNQLEEKHTIVCLDVEHLITALEHLLWNWPQLQHAPIKFGRFIKLYNINVKVLYKQADMGCAAEAGFFWGGGRERFAPQKGVTLHPRVMDFREKKSSASSIRIVKYDMYSIVGIDKKTYGEGISITYIHT